MRLHLRFTRSAEHSTRPWFRSLCSVVAATALALPAHAKTVVAFSTPLGVFNVSLITRWRQLR
jgi:hypothetical protein